MGHLRIHGDGMHTEMAGNKNGGAKPMKKGKYPPDDASTQHLFLKRRGIPSHLNHK